MFTLGFQKTALSLKTLSEASAKAHADLGSATSQLLHLHRPGTPGRKFIERRLRQAGKFKTAERKAFMKNIKAE